MNNTRLAWLAGAWDGEGCIGLSQYNGEWFDKKRNKTRREFKLKPYVILTNTNTSFIAEAVKILDECDIRLNLYQTKRYKDFHTQGYHLQTFNITKIKKLLELLLPYLISKKPQAELLLRFANSRIKNFKPGTNGFTKVGYTEEEVSLQEQLEILNRRGENESSTTIRLTPKGDDIV
jgi:hypothetical protein